MLKSGHESTFASHSLPSLPLLHRRSSPKNDPSLGTRRWCLDSVARKSQQRNVPDRDRQPHGENPKRGRRNLAIPAGGHSARRRPRLKSRIDCCPLCFPLRSSWNHRGRKGRSEPRKLSARSRTNARCRGSITSSSVVRSCSAPSSNPRRNHSGNRSLTRFGWGHCYANGRRSASWLTESPGMASRTAVACTPQSSRSDPTSLGVQASGGARSGSGRALPLPSRTLLLSSSNDSNH